MEKKIKRRVSPSIRSVLLNKLDHANLMQAIHQAMFFNVLDEVVHCENCDERIAEWVKDIYLAQDSDNVPWEESTLDDIELSSPIFYNKFLRSLRES